ncbi:Cutinase [Mycena sanguinolenta]|uniref:cutinase n=1 Tax=Mycena sanguinolenta TaxID=230812 RepID=A0A8H7DI59_9AGAR|nr:Cutinase [Mycena sanguinolenta]
MSSPGRLYTSENKRGLSEVGSNACTDIIVIFARGTGEAAPIGDIVGPQLQASLEKSLTSLGKSLTFAGVDYPADLVGYLEGGSMTGSETMAQDASLLFTSSFRLASIVSVGYSQGAQLVHNSAKLLPPEISGRIKAVVTFGDPDKDQKIENIPVQNDDIICHPLDAICFGSELLDILIIIFLENHLDYNLDCDAAAKFITDRV